MVNLALAFELGLAVGEDQLGQIDDQAALGGDHAKCFSQSRSRTSSCRSVSSRGPARSGCASERTNFISHSFRSAVPSSASSCLIFVPMETSRVISVLP